MGKSTTFGKVVAKKGAGAALRKAASVVNPLDVVRELSSAVREYKTVVQQEKTKREEIAANRAVALESIRSQRAVLLEYLDRSFDERRENFERLFDTLDAVVADGEIQKMAIVLQSIVQLAESSPFKDLMTPQGVQRMLIDKDSSIDL